MSITADILRGWRWTRQWLVRVSTGVQVWSDTVSRLYPHRLPSVCVRTEAQMPFCVSGTRQRLSWQGHLSASSLLLCFPSPTLWALQRVLGRNGSQYLSRLWNHWDPCFRNSMKTFAVNNYKRGRQPLFTVHRPRHSETEIFGSLPSPACTVHMPLGITVNNLNVY